MNTPEIRKKLGAMLREKRKKKGWTLLDLAAEMEADSASLSNYERGLTVPTIFRFVELSKALGFKIDTFIEEVIEQEL